ncbi:putative glucan endo-1,6-beta-glucosidase B [Amylocarpus encephaloides]|uniref:glucan endo-1,6-beta-glucosidase n=1 Tax=Amylocarpus encephaloides TaxID=45428 RepID=A0A9P8C5D7_9HELO|nr:putative glucan endo-1,6-beta-glucosidase B [Amylocarpus encephaloides]
MSFALPFLIILVFLATHALAWLPGEHRDIVNFNTSTRRNFTTAPPLSSGSTLRKPLNQTRILSIPSNKIRGVNLGSLFVFEPWMANTQWQNMGCGPYKSEFDCVLGLGQQRANAAFQSHWNSWITQGDIQQMKNYGLNTIRIPLGYWLLETIVYKDSEHFPQGAFPYLERICGWAADAGFYIILDLHGAPGAQQQQQSFTGQYAPTAGFYQPWQYDRAYQFLAWMTEVVHRWPAFRNVGMIEVVNEPLQGGAPGLTDVYYPGAYKAIREREAKIGITQNNLLHVQTMNTLWGSGDPHCCLPNDWFMSYDDHRYTKWDSSVPVNQRSYISDACHNNRLSNWPTVVGEWSLSVPDNVQWNGDWHPNNQKAFYAQWWAAQTASYERMTNGWVFWSWKTQLGDYRWSYSEAVAAGVIPSNAANINPNACNGF